MEPPAIREAEKVLKEREVASFPIRPIEIAAGCGIACQAMPSPKGGVSGMLLKVEDTFGILYATHINVPGFQSFSIAHELGHYFLPDHPEYIFRNGNFHESSSDFMSEDKYEKQADQFACGLLMPAYLFDPELDRAGTGMDAVLKLADICGTSVTATAIRYAQRHSEPTAIIISTGGVIDYCFMSEELKYQKDITWPKKGTAVPRDSRTKAMTSQQVANGDRLEGDTDMASWFRLSRNISVYEEVVGLGNYAKALTVLSLDGIPSADEDEEEEDLEESWTPIFRR